MTSSNETLEEDGKAVAEELGKRYPDLERVTMVFTWKQDNQDSFLTGISTTTQPTESVQPSSILKTMQQIYRFSNSLNSALLQGVAAAELQIKSLIENMEALRRQHEQTTEHSVDRAESTQESIRNDIAAALDRGSRIASQAKEPEEPFAS